MWLCQSKYRVGPSADTAKCRHPSFHTWGQCRVNHVADVANATGLREPPEVEKNFSARQ